MFSYLRPFFLRFSTTASKVTMTATIPNTIPDITSSFLTEVKESNISANFKDYIQQSNIDDFNKTTNELNYVYNYYKSIKLDKVYENAGKLYKNIDIGEYVRFKLNDEKYNRYPPWFYPSYLLPKPEHLPKGLNISFSFKFKHDFHNGIEPAVNRVCKLQVKISDLKLSPQATKLLAAIAGPRAKCNTLIIACRERPTMRENEVLCLYQLDQLVGKARELEIALDKNLTQEEIDQIEQKVQASMKPYEFKESIDEIDEIDSTDTRILVRVVEKTTNTDENDAGLFSDLGVEMPKEEEELALSEVDEEDLDIEEMGEITPEELEDLKKAVDAPNYNKKK